MIHDFNLRTTHIMIVQLSDYHQETIITQSKGTDQLHVVNVALYKCVLATWGLLYKEHTLEFYTIQFLYRIHIIIAVPAECFIPYQVLAIKSSLKSKMKKSLHMAFDMIILCWTCI